MDEISAWSQRGSYQAEMEARIPNTDGLWLLTKVEEREKERLRKRIKKEKKKNGNSSTSNHTGS